MLTSPERTTRYLWTASCLAAAFAMLLVGCGDLAGNNVDCDAPVELGQNAVANGDAEADAGTDGATTQVTCWSRQEGCFTAMDYERGYGGFHTVRPPNGGFTLFSGGSSCDAGNSTSVGTQTLDEQLAPIADDISAGNLTYQFSADLGGWENQDDAAIVTARFLDASGSELQVATLGPVSSADRGGETGFIRQTTSSDVPTDTASIEIEFEASKTGGSNNDGVADNIRLVFSPN